MGGLAGDSTEEFIAKIDKQKPLDVVYKIIAHYGRDCSWVEVALVMETFHYVYECSNDGSLDDAVCACIENGEALGVIEPSKTSTEVKFRTTPLLLMLMAPDVRIR